MAKVYESAAPHRGIFGQKFRAKFLPDAATINRDNPTGYGKLVSDDRVLMQQLQQKPEDIEALIEKQPEFQANVVRMERGLFGKGGKYAGIWLREWRTRIEGRTTISDFRKGLAAQGDDELRKIIADEGGKVPVNATLDQLVDAAFVALGSPKLPVTQVPNDPPEN